jgi:hypothetical protein
MEITGPLDIGVLDNDANGRELHINANELPLEETIVVNIQSLNPFGNIKIS